MKEFAEKYLAWYAKQDKIVKILFCILWDIPSNLARFCKSAQKQNTLGMIIAVLLAIFGGWILFVVDLITLIAMDKLLWLDPIEG